MRGDEQVQRFTRSVLELVREAVAEAHDNIVAVSIVHVECDDSVQAYVMAHETLNEYAHQLAEKIRAGAAEGDFNAPEYGSYDNVLAAADMIDPKKRADG